MEIEENEENTDSKRNCKDNKNTTHLNVNFLIFLAMIKSISAFPVFLNGTSPLYELNSSSPNLNNATDMLTFEETALLYFAHSIVVIFIVLTCLCVAFTIYIIRNETKKHKRFAIAENQKNAVSQKVLMNV